MNIKPCCKAWSAEDLQIHYHSGKLSYLTLLDIKFCPECGLSLERCKPGEIDIPKEFHKETLEAINDGELIGDIVVYQSAIKINALIRCIKKLIKDGTYCVCEKPKQTIQGTPNSSLCQQCLKLVKGWEHYIYDH